MVDESLREQVLSGQEQHVFSPRLLNTARFGFSRASFYFQGSVPAAIQAETPSFVAGLPTGAVVIAGSTASNGSSSITTAGANVGANNAITRNLFTYDDHIFWTVGRHQIEAGVWVQRLQSNDNLAQDQYGQASFASLASFLAGTIKTFTYAPKPTELGWRSLFADAYLEDTFKVTPRLELRAGIRTESSTGWSESQGRAGVYTFTNGVLNTTPNVQSNALDRQPRAVPSGATVWLCLGCVWRWQDQRSRRRWPASCAARCAGLSARSGGSVQHGVHLQQHVGCGSGGWNAAGLAVYRAVGYVDARGSGLLSSD